MNIDNAELALVKLMELFNHSSVAITKRYLELTYFYKAEMPNCQDWTLDISKLNISLIWDRIIKSTRLTVHCSEKYIWMM